MEEMQMASIIQIRRDTAANWTSANPILAQGEFGYETNTGKLKVGDGVTEWISLLYYNTAGDNTKLLAVAGANINGQRVVMFDSGYKYYNPIEANVDKVVGVSNESVTTGNSLNIITSGLIYSPGWGLTPNSTYYAAASGMLTATVPTSGVLHKIGLAVDADILLVDIGQPMILI